MRSRYSSSFLRNFDDDLFNEFSGQAGFLRAGFNLGQRRDIFTFEFGFVEIKRDLSNFINTAKLL